MTVTRHHLAIITSAAAIAVLGLFSGAAFAASGTARPSTPATHFVSTVQHRQTTAATGETDHPTEQAGQASDGPGGHSDPAGNVDHQFTGQE